MTPLTNHCLPDTHASNGRTDGVSLALTFHLCSFSWGQSLLQTGLGAGGNVNGGRPRRATGAGQRSGNAVNATSVFWAREIQGLLDDLGFRGLLAQHALEVAHTLLQLANLAGAVDIIVGLDGSMATFERATLPSKEL